MTSIAGSMFRITPVLFDTLSVFGRGLTAVSSFYTTKVPTILQDALFFTRSTRVFSFLQHSYEITNRVIYLRKNKERILTGISIMAKTGALVEDVCAVAIFMKTVGLVSAKVGMVAAQVSFAGVAIQGISIGIDAFRIFQTQREFNILSSDKLPKFSKKRKISYQALYGVKRKLLKIKKDSPEMREHLKIRLKTSMALRYVAIVASIVSIVAVAVLMFAPTPAAPVAWTLMGISAVILLSAVVAREIMKYKNNKALAALPNYGEEEKLANQAVDEIFA